MKVDVHFNNGVLERSAGENGYQTSKAEIAREPTEHAYEQICLRQDIPDISGGNLTNTQRKTQDNATDRR